MKAIFTAALGAIVATSLLASCGPSTTRPEEDLAETETGEDAADAEAMEALKALPYLSYVPSDGDADSEDGVTRNDRERAWDGLNMYISIGGHHANLMDNTGAMVHRWQLPGDDVMGGPHTWYFAEPDADGSILLMQNFHEESVLARISADSEVVWMLREHDFHHDVDVAADGTIYALTEGRREIDYDGERTPFRDNYITLLSPAGEIERQLSIYDMMAAAEPPVLPKKAKTRLHKKLTEERLFADDAPAQGVCVFHTNTLELIERTAAGPFAPGRALLALNHFNLVVLVDLERAAIVWSWGGGHSPQLVHMPTLLDNDNVLFLENGFKTREHSTVQEFDPVTGEVVWQYLGDPPESFFSHTRGSAQRLPNGNTLITESDRGRVFEITHDGDIVWEFVNTDYDDADRRRPIYRMMRLARADVAAMGLIDR